MEHGAYKPFATTHWSLIRAADQGEQYKGEAAIDVLLRRYRWSMVCYLRHKYWNSYNDLVEDWVQDFIILKFFQKELLKKAVSKETKFRPFLKGCLQNYAKDKIRRLESASKKMPVCPYFDELENKLSNEEDEGIFEKALTQICMNEAALKTKKHFEEKGDPQAWEIFREYTWLPGLESYRRPFAAELAHRFGCDAKRVHAANDTVKRYYRECLLGIVSIHSSEDESAAEELKDLKFSLIKMQETRINKRKKKSGNSTFSLNDLIDLPSLVAKVKHSDRAFDHWFAGELSVHTKVALKDYQGQSSDLNLLQQSFLEDVNEIIRGDLVYLESRFVGIILRPETEELISHYSSDGNPEYLNRMLIEDAYPLELSKMP